MSTLLSYSGLTTKIRAMESVLIRDEEYRKIAEFTTVGEVVAFLRQRPGYQATLQKLDEGGLHRGDVEKHLTESIYRGFTRIYHFANPEQKKFLDLYFQRYEIFVIKRYFHRLEDHRSYKPYLGDFDSFFRKHSDLKLEEMTAAGSLSELIHSMAGTEYFQALNQLAERGVTSIFDYEMALDLYYFRKIWKYKEKFLKGQDLESLTKAYGVKFEMLNLGWIYRAKKYYRLSSPEIYNMILPIRYKLKPDQVRDMVQANTVEEFSSLLDKTWYAEKFEELSAENIEEMYVKILKFTLEREARKHPYTAANIYAYLYKKEHEIDRLTTAIECIRYNLGPKTTYEYIMRS